MLKIARVWTAGIALSTCALLASCALGATVAHATGTHPVIEWVSTGVGGEVTVGAKINPEGLETSYEIAIECQLREKAGPCETALTEPSMEGVIPASHEGREVSLNATSLKAGSYVFGVLALNSAGGAFWRSELTIPPRIECSAACKPVNPYEPPGDPEAAQHDAEAAAREAQEFQASQQAAAEAAAAHEREVKAQEAARAAAEAAEREAAAKAARACVVPSLKGDSLASAQRALARAHCRLGKVTRPSGSRTLLVVAEQSPKRGRHLKAGAAVSVSLAPAHRAGA